MKALSVRQPWAQLLIIGAKRLETRSWQTSHRGLLAIHASQQIDETAKIITSAQPFRKYLEPQGFDRWDKLPRGAVIGFCHLLDCINCDHPSARTLWHTPDEQAFGDFRAGRWAWLMASEPNQTPPTPLVVSPPIPWKGKLSVFDLPDELFPEHLRSLLPCA